MMDERMKISVIIPVYNTAEYLSQCVESVLTQTYRNIEVILVDDGSTDESGTICDEFEKKDNRCKVIHQENQGLVMARRNGLKASSGKYVGFVDSDDWIDEGMYEYLFDKIREHSAQVVTTGRIIEERKKHKKIKDDMKEGLYHPLSDKHFCKNMIFGKHQYVWGITPNFWNKLFEKEYLMNWQKEVDTKITYGEDDACVYPCMAFAKNVFVSKECFYHYRIRDDSMSNSGDDDYFLRINLLYKCLKNAFERHPLSQILLKELGIYMVEFVIRGVNGLWGIESGISIPRNWMNMCDLPKDEYLLLYGAGAMGKDYYRELCFLGMQDHVIWVDRNFKALSEEGYPVCSIEEVNSEMVRGAFISIVNRKIMNEVKELLISKGIPEDRIYWNRPTGVIEAFTRGI